MNRKEKLPRYWAYLFIAIGLAALTIALVALKREEWVIAAACGFIGGSQLLNFIKWKKQQ